MSSKRLKIENDILIYRNESNWAKVEEYTKLLSKKHSSTDGAVVLLEAEAQLEVFLQEFPPKRKNVSKSRHDLSGLKTKLQEAMSSDCKESIFAVRDEACILLSKLLYAQGNTSSCSDIIKSLDMRRLQDRSPIPCYMQRLLGEIHAIKGLCLEHASYSKREITDRDCTIDEYEISAGFFLSYILELEKIQTAAIRSGTGSHCAAIEPQMSYEMEIALQRAPLLHMRNKNVTHGVQSLRKVLQILKKKTVTGVQQTLARDLSMVLLRGISTVMYESPCMPVGYTENECDGVREKADSSSEQNLGSYLLVSMSASTSDGSLHPTDPTQESILLLVLSEAMFNTDPILDMSPEYASIRSMLLEDSRKLYNLLAIALTRLSEYSMFSKRIECSLKYSYNEFQIWYQCALSLYSVQKYDRCVKVLMECCRIQSSNARPFLLAAKICFDKLDLTDKAIGLASQALVALEQKQLSGDVNGQHSAIMLKAQAHIGVGICYASKCVEGMPRAKVQVLRAKALSSFESAHKADPLNHKPLQLIAIEQALDRQILAALCSVRKALDLDPHNLNCLRLLALLLAANKQGEEACTILNAVCKLHPGNIGLLVTKYCLQMKTFDNEGALQTCHNMMQIWKNLNEDSVNNSLNIMTMVDRLTSDGLSTANQSVGNELDIEAGSFNGNSNIFSRVGHTFSEVESTVLHSKGVAGLAGHPSSFQAHIWLLTAEVYLALNRHDEAKQCIQQASALLPLNHRVFYMQGKLLQCQGQLADAETMFSNTITLNPKHHKALWCWANVALDQGRLQFAKKLFEDALKVNYMSHECWAALGNVLHILGDTDAAAHCLTTAVNLESTSPVLPFTTIMREL